VCFVRSERNGQPVFGFEFVLCRHRIGGDAENVGFGLGEGALKPGEFDRFLGAAGRIRFRIEIKDELAAGIVGKRGSIAAVPRQFEVWSLHAGLELARHAPSFRRFQRGILGLHNTCAA
jgi:hypothetical protein